MEVWLRRALKRQHVDLYHSIKHKQMITKQNITRLFISVILMFCSFQAKPQAEVVNFIMGGVHDAEKLIEAYMHPLGNAMGSNLNGGWYNTANVHSTLGFDITFTMTAAFVPDADKSFDLSEIGLQHLQLKYPDESSITPTFAGKDNKGPTLILPAEGYDMTLVEFDALSGVDLLAYPLPMIKGAVGIPAGIELMGRFVPNYSIDDVDFFMWGAGIKYDILQHLPVAGRIPFLNASLMGAYTNVASSSPVNFQKEMYAEHANLPPSIQGGQEHYDNQYLDITMEGITTMGLISYDLPVISIFGGIGYSTASTNVSLLGDYPTLGLDESTAQVPDIIIEDVSDPISLEFNTLSGLQYTGGLRFKFALFTLHADYTWANYSMVSVGVGLSFR